MTKSALSTAFLVAALASSTGEAQAATVRVVNDDRPGVHFVAAPGERNELTFTEIPESSPTGLIVSDAKASVQVGTGCVSLDAHRAACFADHGSLSEVRARLGDGDDRMNSSGSPRVSAHGGRGDDRLGGGSSDDHLNGGGGMDELRGGPGYDTLNDGDRDDGTGDPPTADVLDGGPDPDWISYEQRLAAVTVDLTDPGPDGALGEADAVVDIENIHGGRGDDTMIGTSAPNAFADEGGDNVINGLAGRDRIERVHSGRVDCGPDRDSIQAPTRPLRLNTDCESVFWETHRGEGTTTAWATPRLIEGTLVFRFDCGSSDGIPARCAPTVTLRKDRRVLARGALGPGAGRRTAALQLTPEGRRSMQRRRLPATLHLENVVARELAWGVVLPQLR